MRYRKLTTSGDFAFGSGAADYLVNTPATVAQAVLTRLRLFTGEWFLDTSEGTPYASDVLGKYTTGVYDAAIRERILGTDGVVSITAYSSSLDRATRQLSINATISSAYGPITVSTVL